MSRQRWGTFSIADHQRPRAFVAEVLLYNRLVIPYPADDQERARWAQMGRDPDRLDQCLAVLDQAKLPSDQAKLASRVPWTEWLWQHAKARYDLSQEVSFDIDNLRTAWQQGSDPMYVTRRILAQTENLPKADIGVAEVLAVAAYPSTHQFIEDFGPRKSVLTSPGERRIRVEKLGWLLGHEFLVPEHEKRSDLELLKEAVELATTPEFQEYRAKLYQWQDNIIQNQIPDDRALEEMHDSLKHYQALVKSARRRMYKKFAYTVLVPGAPPD